jgi:hypothetical protein
VGEISSGEGGGELQPKKKEMPELFFSFAVSEQYRGADGQ